jgi:lipoprotein-releasing system permease protein
LASIISVMLGVATMIVVNAVMTGFAHEMQDRIHGILSDVVFESRSLEGAPDAELRMEEIRAVAGQYIAGMTPTVHVPAMLGYTYAGEYVTRQVNLIGIDEKTYASVSDFGKYLQHPANRDELDFNLKAGGYDVLDHQAADLSKAKPREQMEWAGWNWRRQKARSERPRVHVPEAELAADPFRQSNLATQTDSLAAGDVAVNPLGATAPEGEEFDPAREQHAGCVLGIGLCVYHRADGGEQFLALPGDDVELTYPSAGRPPRPLSAKFTVTDFYESKMQEYDAGFVFAPIRELQELRGMIDPATGVANFNTIRIKLKPGVDLDMVRDLLREKFPPQVYAINTWRDKQGALLAAVQMETVVLNVLLFMIILVAGFGILATFFMIVVEKTRDIGVLKSLGAPASGILGIFLGYGLTLGVFGAGVGVAIGLSIVRHIDDIGNAISRLTGHPVFDPSIYFFSHIPTVIEPLTVALIVIGAVLIALVASILPACRAAWLHPVKALRYE